jgi:hypothetical protein
MAEREAAMAERRLVVFCATCGDARTTRHPGYAVSGRVRKRIEEVFGWTKATAGFRKTRPSH